MIFSFRHISWIAILCSLVGSILLFVVGVQKTFYSIVTFLEGDSETGILDTATLYVIKSLDAFLIAFVLYIFAYGIYKLFINHKAGEGDEVLGWIKISNINHLKKVLAEVIIVVLFVKFLEVVVITNRESFSWELLFLPISIVLLAYALRLLNLAEKE